MQTNVEADEHFGEVTVQLNAADGMVEVSGAAIPSATLRRLDGATPHQHCPIGTRDGAHLDVRVAGIEAAILLPPGGLTRRSYRVDLRHGEVGYRLVPSTGEASTLLRDGSRIGLLTTDIHGGVSAEWNSPDQVDPRDAAVGYLLAASFGTGAQNALVSLLEIFFHT